MLSTVTRTVSKLTSSQLSRKRASDREAQRAARARTKDYIQRLERQVAELRSQRGRNHTIQDLRRRNTALENEIVRLLGNMGLPSFATPSEGVHVLYDSSRLDTASSCTSSSPACQPVTDHLDATMIHAARQEWQQNNWQNDGSYFPAISMLCSYYVFLICV